MNLKKAIQAVSSMDGYEAKIKGASGEKHLHANGFNKPKKS